MSALTPEWVRDEDGRDILAVRWDAVQALLRDAKTEGINHVLELMDASASRDDWGVMAVYPSVVRKKLAEEATH